MADAESERTRIRRFVGPPFSSSTLEIDNHKDIILQPIDWPLNLPHPFVWICQRVSFSKPSRE